MRPGQSPIRRLCDNRPMSRASLIGCCCLCWVFTGCTGTSHENKRGTGDAGGLGDGGQLAYDVGATGGMPGTGVALSGGWRWSNPLPQGGTLRGVWASGANDVWAVGDTILHFDGLSWSMFDKGTPEPLYAVWGSGPQDVWTVGGTGTILHWDGSVWAPVASPVTARLGGLWGNGPGDVWISGDASGTTGGGLLLHWDGARWSDVTPADVGPTETLYSIQSLWGSGPNDLWSVRTDCDRVTFRSCRGSLQRWNGSAWSVVGRSNFGLLGFHALWGSSPDDIWVGGSGPTTSLWHWDGATLSEFPSAAIKTVEGLWGSSAHDVWAVGEQGALAHWDGVAWASVPSGSTYPLAAVWGGGPGEVWAVGSGGTIVFSDRDGARPVSQSLTLPATSLTDIWGTGPEDVWVVGASHASMYPVGQVLRWNGSTWRTVLTRDSATLESLWGSGPNDIWVVGDSELQHWDGAAWATTVGFGGFGDIWGSAPDDVWAVGRSIMHWNGASWSTVAQYLNSEQFGTNIGLNALWGSGRSDVWALSSVGAIFHWDGAAWTEWPATGLLGSRDSLTDLWGSGANDVWAIGRNGVALHWNGIAWAAVPTQSQANLRGIWGSGSDDVWAVGEDILHWDGSRWSALGRTDLGLGAVWGSVAGDLWAVGRDGNILHR